MKVRCSLCGGLGGVMEDWDKASPCLRCHDTGEEPVYQVVPFMELSMWQQMRVRWFTRDSGVYMRNQFGDTIWEPSVGSPDYIR